MISPDLPPGYKVRLAKSYSDRWQLFKLLVLKREPEPQKPSINVLRIGLILGGILGLGFCLFLYLLGREGLLNTEPGMFLVVLISVPVTILCTIIGVYIGIYMVFALVFFWILFRAETRIAIALYRGIIVGGAQINHHQNYMTLAGLYISPRHRKRGVGSYLVKNILSGAYLPVYVLAMPGLEPFYARIGFVECQYKRGYNMRYSVKSI
jgi:Acetyltransferase (GNAT) domain